MLTMAARPSAKSTTRLVSLVTTAVSLVMGVHVVCIACIMYYSFCAKLTYIHTVEQTLLR